MGRQQELETNIIGAGEEQIASIDITAVSLFSLHLIERPLQYAIQLAYWRVIRHVSLCNFIAIILIPRKAGRDGEASAVPSCQVKRLIIE